MIGSKVENAPYDSADAGSSEGKMSLCRAQEMCLLCKQESNVKVATSRFGTDLFCVSPLADTRASPRIGSINVTDNI